MATKSLEDRKEASARQRHPDERAQFRKLLTDPDQGPISMLTRPRNGCCWGGLGAALRQFSDKASDRTCPQLINEAWDCFELDAAFPEFCAVGARPLLPRMKNRLVFEVRTDVDSRAHIMQVGLARVGGDQSQLRSGTLDKSTPLLETFLYTSAGDVMCSEPEDIEIIAPGTMPGIRFRRENWCSGAPNWLSGGSQLVHIMMEVDLRRGRIALSVGEWSSDPLILSIPGLLEGVDEKEWLPFVSLTAIGQSARLLDFHASVEA